MQRKLPTIISQNVEIEKLILEEINKLDINGMKKLNTKIAELIGTKELMDVQRPYILIKENFNLIDIDIDCLEKNVYIDDQISCSTHWILNNKKYHVFSNANAKGLAHEKLEITNIVVDFFDENDNKDFIIDNTLYKETMFFITEYMLRNIGKNIRNKISEIIDTRLGLKNKKDYIIPNINNHEFIIQCC